MREALADQLTDRRMATRNGKPYSQTQVVRFIKAMRLERIDGGSKAAKQA